MITSQMLTTWADNNDALVPAADHYLRSTAPDEDVSTIRTQRRTYAQRA